MKTGTLLGCQKDAAIESKNAAPLHAPDEKRLRELTEEEERAAFGDDNDEPEVTCVDPECGNPARRGEFCDERHSRREDEQRAKSARRSRGSPLRHQQAKGLRNFFPARMLAT